MAPFSSLSKNLGKLISTKPILISSEDLETAGKNIKLVGIDPIKRLEYNTEKPFSPRLLNWVEPYTISGIQKTLFYTEINSGLKVGDRVFIMNGNYDSDLLIKIDKYKKGRDGYKILLIDHCKVVLDIDYTGESVWLDDDLDQFIKIRNVKTTEDFLHANREITTRGGNFDYKYNKYKNYIIYTEEDFNPITDWGKNAGLSGSPGFFVRDGINGWINITTDFMSGSFSYALSASYSTNNNVRILNDTFTYDGFEFKEGFTYEWGMAPEHDAVPGTQSQWIINTKFDKSLLTKGNFRGGNFKGEWNTGVYGRQDEKIKWVGKGNWNNGTLLNTNWEQGTFESKYTLTQSYLSEFDEYGVPYQKINGPNNNGRGFNYIIDSEIKSSVINNGSFINTNIGEVLPSTYSIVENHILSTSQNYNNKANQAFFEDCLFIDAFIDNSEVKTSRSMNTMFNNINSVNSNYNSSVIKNSNYLSDDIIKVLDYDEFNISEYIGSGTVSSRSISHKVYKFYISRSSYERLRLKDSFYIKGVQINNNSKDVINFFDKKLRLGSWSEYLDEYTTVDITQPQIVGSHSFHKRGVEYSTFLSTPGENEWRYTSIIGGFTEVIDENSKSGYSIDIITSIYDIHSPLKEVFDRDFNMESISPSLTGINKTLPTPLGDNIDFSNAYIIDSDFESGMFETSNWNSGRHIEYNNDINISTPTNKGGYYNLSVSTSSSILTATTTYNTEYPEAPEECLEIGNIVFLNNVDYDTTGKISSLTMSVGGSGYTQSGTNIPTTGGSGTNLTIDYIANEIGSALTIISLVGGSGYSDTNPLSSPGNYTSTTSPPVLSVGGSGTGLTIDVTVSSSVIISATISNPGSGYLVGDVISLSISGNTTANVTISSISVGDVIDVVVNTSGVGYTVGDVITINDGDNNSMTTVLSTTGSVVMLADTYKILPGTIPGVLQLEEVVTGTYSILSTLLDGGTFNTVGAFNRYGYIYKSKFNKSKIMSGMFRRTYLKESFVENDSFDVNDKDYTNLESIKSMVISDSLFRDNSNILSKGLYINSHIVNGTDNWLNILGDSLIWNGSTLEDGVVKNTRWINGIFKAGVFYNNNTFDATPDVNRQFYNDENIKSYYKDGITEEFTYNNRNSWQDGIFKNGEFYKSDWEMGTFSNGIFYYSKFYDGVVDGGVIGDSSVSVTDTLIYNGVINYTTVENATLYAIDTSHLKVTDNNITWYDGIFNTGVFGCDILQSATHTTTWVDGIFNGGQFVTNGKWMDGVFNGGKFISGYGWTQAGSTTITDYGWEDGIFNGGEFGNADLGTNSIWYSGEFNGGKFTGRYWNSGVLTSGHFQGSATYAAVGGYKVDGMTTSNAYDFVESYTQSYYGKWNDGYFTNIKDKFIKDKKIYSIKNRAIKRIKLKTATFENALWMSGTFSHTSGEFKESVWLDGGFEAGTFKSSSFNPWVLRDNGIGAFTQSFNLNDDLTTGSGSCVWYNGVFDDSDFYISQWNQGKWLSGTAFGMIWKNGISNYMNAYNICWHDGTWRNGNWQGSYFKFDGCVTDSFNKQLVYRVMNCTGTSSMHTWNIFTSIDLDTNVYEDALPSTPDCGNCLTDVGGGGLGTV